MKLHIDWTACDGRGSVYRTAAGTARPRRLGLSLARDGDGTEPRVPAGLARYARRAVAQCPRLALRLVS